jgi:hypothetical protein
MSAIDAFEGVERYIGAIGMWISGDEIARIRDGRDLLLTVQYGTVWITQAGSIKDIFIGAGGSFLIDRDGCTLVSLGGSEPAAAITLMPSIHVRPTIAQRLAAGLRRRSNAIASIVVLARDIRVEVLSGGLPARLRPVGFNRDRFNHAA